MTLMVLEEIFPRMPEVSWLDNVCLFILILAAFMIISIVGYSRIYLKKHYLTDVIAGFLIGTAISISIVAF
mgnify:CR=1 FL=1